MNFIKKYWEIVIVAITGIIGFIVYALNSKKTEESIHAAVIDLAKTQKEADAIEVNIKALKDDKSQTTKQIESLDKDLVLVDKKREELKAAPPKTDKEIEDFWKGH